MSTETTSSGSAFSRKDRDNSAAGAHLEKVLACEGAVRVSEPSPKTWPRRGNGWNSNERDDPVVSRIDDCDCVICRVDCVEQTG